MKVHRILTGFMIWAAIPILSPNLSWGEGPSLKAKWQEELNQQSSAKISLKDRRILFVAGFLNEGIAGYFSDNVAIAKEEWGAEASVFYPSSRRSIPENAELLRLEIYKRYSANRKPIILVGHSKGGAESLFTVLRNPDLVLSGRVDKVILLQAALGGSPVADSVSGLGLIASLPDSVQEGLRSLKTQATQDLFKLELDKLRAKISLSEVDLISNRIFIVESTQIKGHVAAELILTHGYLSQFGDGRNDGLLLVNDQRIPGFGIDLGTVDGDHAALTVSGLLSNSSAKERRAFMRALFLRILEEEKQKESEVQPVIELTRPLMNLDLSQWNSLVARNPEFQKWLEVFENELRNSCDSTQNSTCGIEAVRVSLMEQYCRLMMPTESRLALILSALEAFKAWQSSVGEIHLSQGAMDLVSDLWNHFPAVEFQSRFKQDPSGVYLIQDLKNYFWLMADDWAKQPALPIPPKETFVYAAASGSVPVQQGFFQQNKFRTRVETYNRRYAFILRDGNVWLRPNSEETGISADWIPLKVPAEIAGKIIEISSDDSYVVAISDQRDIWTMSNALGDPSKFSWTKKWGAPLWRGAGMRLPADRLAWDISCLSPEEDQYFLSSTGNKEYIGNGVTTLYVLRGGGQRITYLDPWLPADESYEVCGPKRGRFKAIALSASGSTIFVMNQYGDLFTRRYDFDLAGGDHIFFKYSYQSQKGKTLPWPLQSRQLPLPDWEQQPKIMGGKITDLISIFKWGEGAVHRTLRVEGLDADGNPGFYEKDIQNDQGQNWRFQKYPTAQKLRGHLLNPILIDSSEWGLGNSEDKAYWSTDGHVEVLNFNPYCTPAMLRLHFKGEETPLNLVLHTTEALRTSKRERGLNDDPMKLYGTIEISREIIQGLASLSAEKQDFIRSYLEVDPENPFTSVDISATQNQLVISNTRLSPWKSSIQWTLNSQ